MRGVRFFFTGVLITVALLQFQNLSAQTITINTDSTFQVIRGFGGMNYVTWGVELNNEQREMAFGNEPGQLGLSILRIPVPPDAGSFSRELPTAAYAIEKGAIVFASPWNPPSNIRSVLGQFGSETDYVLEPEYYDDYAVHLNSFITFMNNNGVPLYAISIQNEPDWHGWTTWTPAQLLKFLKENAGDINCRVIAPESYSYIRSTIDPLLNNSEANSEIDILGTHLYGTSKSNYYYPLALAKNKEIWMTEHLLGSQDAVPDAWSLAMELADELNTCMDANMSAFVYWYIHRFYGLIDNASNITNKGYVMSQFAKFIRPGAYRVYTDYDAVSNVTATAYKTDTSLAIVVVNHNRSAKNLNFNIEQVVEGVESLTQFTTTEIKRVVNEGSIALSGGSFSATVDASSVTTFTSDASRGGRFGNQLPVASGGGDQEILDTLGIQHTVTLKGSESYDTDGEIVKYSWSFDGNHVSDSPDLDIQLSIGNYEYILTVTDNDGAVDTDTVNIKIYNQNSAEIWLEAECTVVGSNWNQLFSSSCSNNKYLTVKAGTQSLSGASANTNDHLVYGFYLPQSGNYKIWGRVMVPSADDDSYWVKVDNGDWINWNSIVGGSDWQWDDVHNQSNNSPMIYALDTGYHTLSVCYREDGAAIDKFYITNTGNIPSGKGDDAVCETNSAVYLLSSANLVKLFPNPVKSNLGIESEEPFYSLNIYDMKGRVVFEKEYQTATCFDNITVNFNEGIYMLQLFGDNPVAAKRFLVDHRFLVP